MSTNETTVTNSVVEETVEDSAELVELTRKRSERPEIGAMWDKTSKKSGMQFYTLKVTLTKDKIEELVSQITRGGEVATLEMVAFPCSKKEDNSRRPAYRIFEELW